MRRPGLASTSGFTLLEIITVVAIMALLAGLTVPKFQRMVNKANQKGAVVLLTSAYMAEKNFAAENSTYTTCLRNIGLSDPPTRWYTVGINGQAVTDGCGPSDNQPCNVSAWDDTTTVATCNADALCHTGTNDGDTICADRTESTGTPIPGPHQLGTLPDDVRRTTFVVRAVGNIGSVSDYDRWAIDQGGNPNNTVSNY